MSEKSSSDYGFISPKQIAFILDGYGYDDSNISSDIDGAVNKLEYYKNVDPYYLTKGREELPDLLRDPDKYMDRDNYNQTPLTPLEKNIAKNMSIEDSSSASVQQILYRTKDAGVTIDSDNGHRDSQLPAPKGAGL